jgi:nucleotide-binding universal stress UspA family protein
MIKEIAMSQKILVAIDGDNKINQHVFQEALELAKVTGASLKLLHVLSVDEKDHPNILTLINSPENKKQWEEFEKVGRELLQSLAELAIDAGVPTEYVQALGRPGYIICDMAKTWGADLIVVGRRGYSGLSELILGSVSNYVAHYAPCSVMLVQGSTVSHKSHVRESRVATPV